MGTEVTRPPSRDVRTYDPGPSGTAVAALVIALIALAVALYAAFAPGKASEEARRALLGPIERATEGPGKTASAPGPQGQRSWTPEELRKLIASESRQQVEALKKEITGLRAQLESGGKSSPPPAAHKAGGKQGASQ